MPFPYVTASTLDTEISYTRQGFGLTQNEWTDLLERKCKQETERVESWIDQSWRPDDADVPFVIRAAVIRLARSTIHQIEEDGLEQESAEDRSEIYRPPQAIREEVRTELGEAGYDTGNIASLRVPSVR